MRNLRTLVSVAIAATTLIGCGTATNSTGDTDKITVHTHMSQLVLGEEKKDDNGNTYRDESTAYLAQLAKEFTAETGIEVELVVSQSA
ncbi:MAG: hypothetical protein ACRDCN_10475, partial [Tannerellaceae bacterium]